MASAHCCPHRGLDHGAGIGDGKLRPGQPCTMPGCSCKGWAARENGGKPVRVKERAKCVALWKEGLTAKLIAARVGVSVSLVTDAVRAAGLSDRGRTHRSDCPSVRETPRRCEVLPAKKKFPTPPRAATTTIGDFMEHVRTGDPRLDPAPGIVGPDGDEIRESGGG